MDKRVEIHGTSRADINGQRGVATNFHFDYVWMELSTASERNWAVYRGVPRGH